MKTKDKVLNWWNNLTDKDSNADYSEICKSYEDVHDCIGYTGEIVDIFENELSIEEWEAINTVHNLSNRLNIGIRFDYSKSIDVKSKYTSQIIDCEVFQNKCIK